MNTSQIKAYAPQARNDFIQAVTERANLYGIYDDKRIEPIDLTGDVALIGGRAFSKKEGELRERLVSRVKQDGFQQVMEAFAYTWFNRFVALRYMEIHDYLGHGYRVLSNRSGSDIPEILENAADVEFEGLNKEKVIELRLAGNKDNELYRLLIVAQCNALNKAMPFLFDRVDNETELLLPDNLLHSNSPIRNLVNDISEDSWQDVEIIGWIYQFYISEKKDQVIGKVVKSEDIPAATQLFTPNWIVKYMVQNTLGRMWLATYPDSPLRDKMEYYIEPAEQEPEVQAELDKITPKALNPEEITFLDPACGSGHILIEAYAIFKEIYLERGYRTRDIPRLILEKNIFGLDICDRAAQLACFVLLMKAREDDRRILRRDDVVNLNVMAIQEGRDSDNNHIDIFFKGDEDNETRKVLKELVKLFENGKTFGSLITIPELFVRKIDDVKAVVDEKLIRWGRDSKIQNIKALVEQAWVLAKKYDCVVTNPPYMGNKGMNPSMKKFAKIQFSDCKSDFFAMFADKIISHMTLKSGAVGLVMPYVWMFLSSYEPFRKKIIKNVTLTSLIQLEYNAFEPACIPVATFTLVNYPHDKYKGYYIKLSDFKGHQNQAPRTLEAIQTPSCSWKYTACSEDFNNIPGSPIAYWIKGKELFGQNKISDRFISGGRNKTHNNEKYLRFSWEVEKDSKKWIVYLNGGGFRKYYGNELNVVDWSESARVFYESHGGLCNKKFWNKEGITWSLITSSISSFRIKRSSAQYSSGSPTIFNSDFSLDPIVLGFLNSPISNYYLKALNPTLNTTVNDILSLPYIPQHINSSALSMVNRCIAISETDWHFYEISLDFLKHPLQIQYDQSSLKKTYFSIRSHWQQMAREMQQLEQENNRIFIEAYDLQDELTPQVPLSEITLTCNPHYRYGANKTEEELEALLQTDTIKELISYSIGCMMGRYSLDEPGLIYAHSGNVGFDHSRYQKFPADDDGIVPVMDQEWFPDDATNRFIEFLKVAWTPETLEENLKFVADSLKPKTNETPVDTIRRYISTGFFKDHLRMYKKRPIYWLFSSGRQKAFQCLVYLHRYNESTLARMRSAYVTPLQGHFTTRIEFLESEKDAVKAASAQGKIQKEIELIKKKLEELRKFDDKLRHYSDMKIPLDLDDGVKVNYGKFGDLLAEKKAITGKK